MYEKCIDEIRYEILNVMYRKEEIEEKSTTVKHYEKISEKLKEIISSKPMIYI